MKISRLVLLFGIIPGGIQLYNRDYVNFVIWIIVIFTCGYTNLLDVLFNSNWEIFKVNIQLGIFVQVLSFIFGLSDLLKNKKAVN